MYGDDNFQHEFEEDDGQGEAYADEFEGEPVLSSQSPHEKPQVYQIVHSECTCESIPATPTTPIHSTS